MGVMSVDTWVDPGVYRIDGPEWSVEVKKMPWGGRCGVITVRGKVISETPYLLTPHDAILQAALDVPSWFRDRDPLWESIREACNTIHQSFGRPIV